MYTELSAILAQAEEGGNWNLFVLIAAVGAIINGMLIASWWPNEHSLATNRSNGFTAKAVLLTIASVIGMAIVTMYTKPAATGLNYFIIMLPTGAAVFPLSYSIFRNPKEPSKE